MRRITAPVTARAARALEAGDQVFFSGILLTARDQAHLRLCEYLRAGKDLPVRLQDQIIYYCGPAAAPKGRPVGSCGPTTSARMDAYTVPLLKAGLRGMAGKGRRSEEVRRAIRKYRAVYFLAPAGCGALLARKVTAARRLCFADLGPEAVYELTVRDFPFTVGIDTRGESIFHRRTKGVFHEKK
ncbi:MAG: TRZ/ATZ family protein [Candidatus Omnitrophica bacterium]|nr:TRZ/ATZ family protein [Candidatus Omnitrophota bacterium]